MIAVQPSNESMEANDIMFVHQDGLTTRIAKKGVISPSQDVSQLGSDLSKA